MKINIFWLRRDLRVKDNHGLLKALKGNNPVLLLFIFDTNIVANLDKNDPRITFIYDALSNIHNEVLKHKSSLLVEHGTPENVFSKLLDQYQIEKVYANSDYEPYAVNRDKQISLLLKEKGATLNLHKDQVIFEKEEVLTQSGSPYKVFTAYKNQWKKQFSDKSPQAYPSEAFLHNLKRHEQNLPSLSHFGFVRSSMTFPPSQPDNKIIRHYDETRDNPSLPTTQIGVHLRFGTASTRAMVKKAAKLNDTWLNELIWREFYMQLLYHFPKSEHEAFNPNLNNLPWRYSDAEFERWCEGTTGYPLVDAGMRQLNETGFMHNRVRMVVASFLTKHLLLNWTLGERYFANKLLDFDLAANVGNWQWVAGTGADAQPFIRIFNPTLQQKRFDPKFDYIKKWVPEYETGKYPTPIIDHKQATERAKNAFESLK
ncbi:deoxyribodipyrimidine photo-lyase [Cytophagaceae bacterium ABcell3]|nr:deoxyribodipyrimidine photo-lyase [Cytophagaceae bacterium ABcell3]